MENRWISSVRPVGSCAFEAALAANLGDWVGGHCKQARPNFFVGPRGRQASKELKIIPLVPALFRFLTYRVTGKEPNVQVLVRVPVV